MKYIISEKLLSILLDENINSCWLMNDKINIQYSLIEIIPHEPLSYINKFELMNLAKKLILDTSNFQLWSFGCGKVEIYDTAKFIKSFIADNEPEAVFKACEWILNNKAIK